MTPCNILVVCTANSCRSPLGEAVLRNLLPRHVITSCGMNARVGWPAFNVTAKLAAEEGFELSSHRTRQFNQALARSAQLILGMERHHCDEITRQMPMLVGRVHLFDRWSGATGIPDPMGGPIEKHRRVLSAIIRAAEPWAAFIKDELGK